ncbi:MAG: N-acetyltransferase family protein [Pseudomonadota bacterium]
MSIIDCTEERHAGAILAIFNEAIVNSTAMYDYQPRTPESMVAWFALKRQNGFPVIGIEDEQGSLLGVASYGSFRAWPAYKYSVEHSIYVHKDHQGVGYGRVLLERLIRLARENSVHTLIGGIDMSNAGSIALHERFGFEHAGTIRQAAYKFDRWLDLGFFQLLLETPASPVEG